MLAVVEFVDGQSVVLRTLGKGGRRWRISAPVLVRKYDLWLDVELCPFCRQRPRFSQLWHQGVFEVWCHGFRIVRGHGYQAEAAGAWREWCREFAGEVGRRGRAANDTPPEGAATGSGAKLRLVANE